jgi:hypothetical protein
MEKTPSEFVWVAAVAPLAATLAPTTGCPLASVTLPVMVFFPACEKPLTGIKTRKNTKIEPVNNNAFFNLLGTRKYPHKNNCFICQLAFNE